MGKTHITVQYDQVYVQGAVGMFKMICVGNKSEKKYKKLSSVVQTYNTNYLKD